MVPVGVVGEPVTVAVSVADVPLTVGVVERLTVHELTLKVELLLVNVE